jgi:hypothetical protein
MGLLLPITAYVVYRRVKNKREEEEQSYFDEIDEIVDTQTGEILEFPRTLVPSIEMLVTARRRART